MAIRHECRAMSTASLRMTKTGSRRLRSSGGTRGKVSKMPRAKASGKEVVFSHPAAFGEAVRKYAGIVRSGVGDLSTRDDFDE
jgi:hypothetical protein